ncbi:MAG: hypothetical protein ACM3QU_06970 [Verrucomicrobiota bacterium]
MSAEPAQPAAPPAPSGPSRTRIILARTLTVIGILLVVVSALANYVKREALDSSQFHSTSRRLVADETIRDQVALTLVDRLYANTDVVANLQEKLPENLRPLAVPIAGVVRNAADSAAKELLSRPRVQELFVNAASRAQKAFIAVLDGKEGTLSTTNGNVVLDLRPILTRLGERFDVVQEKVPPDAGQITILQSDQLKTGQRLVRALRFVASWIWALALIAWAAAIWIARGRRRLEVRAIAIGFVAAGFLILIVRGLSERYFVNHLIKSDSVRPSGQHAFQIITGLLKGAGWTAVIVGVVALVGVWLCGPGRRAGQVRQFLAPYLSGAGAYAATIGGYLLLLWWRPTPQFGYWLNVLIFFVLLMIGTEVLRRRLARERPPQPASVT